MSEKPGPKVGSHNKAKERLFKALVLEYGEDFDPVLQMAKNAMCLQGRSDALIEAQPEDTDLPRDVITAIQDANKEWEKVAPYVQAKMKQVDVNAEVETTINIITDRDRSKMTGHDPMRKRRVQTSRPRMLKHTYQHQRR